MSPHYEQHGGHVRPRPPVTPPKGAEPAAVTLTAQQAKHVLSILQSNCELGLKTSGRTHPGPLTESIMRSITNQLGG